MSLMIEDDTPEWKFQIEVVRFAHEHGWRVHFDPASHRRGMLRTQSGGDNGYVDVTLARAGVVHHWELKSADGVLSAEQKVWREALGESWKLWKPKDRAEIERVLA